MATATRGAGLGRTVQESFISGMYRSSTPDLIPPTGAYDLTNCIIDRAGAVYRRGGSVYRSTAAFGAGLRWIWDGVLANGGHQTLLASTAAFGRLEANGTVTSLAEGGLTTPTRPAVFQGVLTFPGGKTYNGSTWATQTGVAVGTHYTVAASRLVTASGRTVHFSSFPKKTGENVTWAETDFHELPEGVEVIGLQGARDSCIVFTTGGVWVISNLSLNLTDASGNIQQRLDHYSGDLILWGEAGIAAWEGALIVPAIDGVWMVKRGVTSEVISSFQRMSDPIRDLYQQYVRQGYEPGQGCVFNNHYLLPIIGGGLVQDMLVCRLDVAAAKGAPPGAWTHFRSPALPVSALTARVNPASQSREPELLGVTYDASARVLTCSYFNPSVDTATDADGSAPEWQLETRSFTTGNLVPNLVAKLRARYQTLKVEGGVEPRIVAEVASDAPVPGSTVWNKFVWGVGKWATVPPAGGYQQISGEAPEDPEAANPFTWNLHKKRRFVRFHLSCKQATGSLILKALELFVRERGRV